MKKVIATTNAPAAIGPYSQAILAGDTLYISGQLGLDPATGEFVSDDVVEQARQAFKNIKGVLEEAGLTMENVVKTSCFLADINDFAAVNEVYKEVFAEPFPARSALEISVLPKNALVEIETIAYVGK